MFDNIVIGVDGRRGGHDAVALAEQLAAPGASFTLVHVAARGPVSWWRHQMAEEHIFDREASMLVAERQSAAIQARIVCVGGVPPARGLHDLARERAADLIVVGCSRRALLGRILLGDDARASLTELPARSRSRRAAMRTGPLPWWSSASGMTALPRATMRSLCLDEAAMRAYARFLRTRTTS